MNGKTRVSFWPKLASFTLAVVSTPSEVDAMKTLREVARILEPSAHQISARQIASDLSIEGRVSLREILEFEFVESQKLSANIVAATRSFKGSFPSPGQWFNNGRGLNETQVNSFFGGSSNNVVDCLGAALIIMARGLIQTLRTGEFDIIGYTTSRMHLDFRPIPTTDQMLVGDWAYFQNDLKYLQKHPGGGYQGENVIKVSASMYYGFPAGTKTEEQWKQELIDAYNSGLPAGEHINITDIPGFRGDVNQTFDARSLSLDVWKLRRP